MSTHDIHVAVVKATLCNVACFTLHLMVSEINHKRRFIKIPFVNKDMYFIDFQSIVKDNLVISSIPNYFNNSETLIICYNYNKPIRSTVFNVNKTVTDIKIDSNTLYS